MACHAKRKKNHMLGENTKKNDKENEDFWVQVAKKIQTQDPPKKTSPPQSFPGTDPKKDPAFIWGRLYPGLRAGGFRLELKCAPTALFWGGARPPPARTPPLPLSGILWHPVPAAFGPPRASPASPRWTPARQSWRGGPAPPRRASSGVGDVGRVVEIGGNVPHGSLSGGGGSFLMKGFIDGRPRCCRQ